MNPHRVLELIVAHLNGGGTLDDFESNLRNSEHVRLAEYQAAVRILRHTQIRVAREQEDWARRGNP